MAEEQKAEQKAPEFILVKSTHPGPLHFGAVEERHEITLMPGVNKVPAEAWEELQKSAKARPAVKHYFDEGKVEALRGKKPSEFSKMATAEALKLVKDTNREDLLKEFRRGEQRPEVLDAIEEQIKKLQPEA